MQVQVQVFFFFYYSSKSQFRQKQPNHPPLSRDHSLLCSQSHQQTKTTHTYFTHFTVFLWFSFRFSAFPCCVCLLRCTHSLTHSYVVSRLCFSFFVVVFFSLRLVILSCLDSKIHFAFYSLSPPPSILHPSPLTLLFIHSFIHCVCGSFSVVFSLLSCATPFFVFFLCTLECKKKIQPRLFVFLKCVVCLFLGVRLIHSH